ncbi:MAG: hypothetical protein CUN56_15820, partial [Phototrophicales bacterium]
MQTRLNMLLFGWAVSVWNMACITTVLDTKPDDMSAEQHQQAAQAEYHQAQTHVKRYLLGQRIAQVNRFDSNNDLIGDVRYRTSEIHLNHAAQHEDHARQHARAAAELERFEDMACEGVTCAFCLSDT